MDARIIKEIVDQAPLDKDEIRRAAAKSRKLDNILKNTKDMGLEVSVIHIPPCFSPCTGDQVDG